MIGVRLEYDRMTLDWDKEVESDIRKFTVNVARDALAREQRNGFDRRPRTIVDRTRYDAPIESVRAFGVIEYVQRVNLREAAEWIWSEVFRRSPVDEGTYQDSHVIMVNGLVVANLDALKAGDRVQIVNTQPYARKIERGLSLMAPNGVYRLVYAAARRRFRGAFIDSRWVRLDGVGPAQTLALAGGGRNRSRKMRDTVYPAIQISTGGQA